MKHFTSVNDVKNLGQLLEKAKQIKSDPTADQSRGGKKIGLIFLNPSLRTRLSSIVAAQHLGIDPVVLDIGKDGWALEFSDGVKMDGDKAEHIKEAAAVMGLYFDALGVRTFPQLKDQQEDYAEEILNGFINYANVPIVSLESATAHPLQGFADLLTIKEQWKLDKKPKVVLTWAPHVKALPQAVPNSFVNWMLAADMDLTITHPAGYELDEKVTKNAQLIHDQSEALKDADFVYVKNWSSFNDYGKVLSTDTSWTFSKAHHDLTNQAKVMHCLPVRRGLVIANEVLDSEYAIHLEQANNRVYAMQTVLSELL